MPQKKDYVTEATKLAKAIDIATESFRRYPPKGMNENHILHIVQLYAEWKYSALNPAPEYRKLGSLKYFIEDVFTLFQESSGEAVEYFWVQVDKAELGYVRVDKLRKIIARGRIKGRLEFEYIVDTYIAANQEGRINDAEASQLSSMLGDFENRKGK